MDRRAILADVCGLCVLEFRLASNFVFERLPAGSGIGRTSLSQERFGVLVTL